MRLRAIGLILTLALTMLAVPCAAPAPPAGKVWRIGVLDAAAGPVPETAFQQALRDLGYVEGQHVTIAYRYAHSQRERLAALAAELVQLPVDILMVTGDNAAHAAQQATRTMPIVLVRGADPVARGLVASLARPGGNVTGMTTMGTELGGKRLELLKEAVPTASRVGVLVDPANINAGDQRRALEPAARSLGVELHILEVRQADALEHAFATATQAGVHALLLDNTFFTATHQPQILQLVAQSRLPVMASTRDWVQGGILMSYDASSVDAWRRAATYVDKIFNGATPADLPIERPTKFELVINLKTAAALGLTIPPSILFQADEVIR
jgi:putative tryptophan/tyrosine transport system substrate-binding protein